MKRLVILGSTGSVGRQTLDVVRHFPHEFQVWGLAAGYNLELFQKQIQEFVRVLGQQMAEWNPPVADSSRRALVPVTRRAAPSPTGRPKS